MSIRIGSYNFDGPYTHTGNLYDRSGVYAILDVQPAATHVVDIGESGAAKTRIENHDRKSSWGRHARGKLSVAVLYMPSQQQGGRMQIEQALRRQFNPPCGVN